MNRYDTEQNGCSILTSTDQRTLQTLVSNWVPPKLLSLYQPVLGKYYIKEYTPN